MPSLTLLLCTLLQTALEQYRCTYLGYLEQQGTNSTNSILVVLPKEAKAIISTVAIVYIITDKYSNNHFGKMTDLIDLICVPLPKEAKASTPNVSTAYMLQMALLQTWMFFPWLSFAT